MDEWFGLYSEYNFTLFSESHWAALAIAVTGSLILFLTFKKWPDYPKTHNTVRWLLFSLLLLSEVSYQFWTHYHRIWSFSDHSPLHLCGIASLIAMFALAVKKPFFIQLAFFFGVVPSFLALVTPDIPYDFQHYRFWKFFIHHTVISWACLFLALSRPELITFRSFLKSYGLLLVYAAFIGIAVNPLTGANYLYLHQPPPGSTLLSFFGEGYLYIFNLCMVAFFIFFLQYLGWKWLFRHKAVSASKNEYTSKKARND